MGTLGWHLCSAGAGGRGSAGRVMQPASCRHACLPRPHPALRLRCLPGAAGLPPRRRPRRRRTRDEHAVAEGRGGAGAAQRGVGQAVLAAPRQLAHDGRVGGPELARADGPAAHSMAREARRVRWVLRVGGPELSRARRWPCGCWYHTEPSGGWGASQRAPLPTGGWPAEPPWCSTETRRRPSPHAVAASPLQGRHVVQRQRALGVGRLRAGEGRVEAHRVGRPASGALAGTSGPNPLPPLHHRRGTRDVSRAPRPPARRREGRGPTARGLSTLRHQPQVILSLLPFASCT